MAPLDLLAGWPDLVSTQHWLNLALLTQASWPSGCTSTDQGTGHNLPHVCKAGVSTAPPTPSSWTGGIVGSRFQGQGFRQKA